MRGFSRFTLCLAAVTSAIGSAEAGVIDVFTNTTDWSESTHTENGGVSGDWAGLGALPGAVTTASFSIATSVYVGTTVESVTGTDVVLAAGDDVRFFRTTFDLGSFTSVTADLRVNVDNDVEVYLNGDLVAFQGDQTSDSFTNPAHYASIASDGTVTNGSGPLGALDSFDSVSGPFVGWNQGENELILAVRNVTGGDTGGFAFAGQFTTAAVPEPATFAFLGLVGQRHFNDLNSEIAGSGG